MEKKDFLNYINSMVKDTMMEHMDIVFTDFGTDFIEASMPVSAKTINPAKIMHGGALMALAETVGSGLSLTQINAETHDVRGLEINGNHVKSVPSGKVFARATLVHKGSRTHVCEIKITNTEGELVNVSRMTNMIVEK